MVFIRLAGAVYLIWMGVSLWFSKPTEHHTDIVKASRGSLLKTYLTGVALNIGNPKMPLFYLAILPNVAVGGVSLGGYAELVLTILAVEIIVIGAYAGLALKARALAASAIVMRRMNRAAGAVMAATVWQSCQTDEISPRLTLEGPENLTFQARGLIRSRNIACTRCRLTRRSPEREWIILLIDHLF